MTRPEEEESSTVETHQADEEAQAALDTTPEEAPEATLDVTPEEINEEIVDVDDCKSVEMLSSDSGIGVTPPDGHDAGYPVAANLLDTTQSLIEEALNEMDKSVDTVVESEVFYDSSVTSGAQFDEWQLRTPTELDDASPVFKVALDFDALVSDIDESKQLEPDDEELFRTGSFSSESDMETGATPPPPAPTTPLLRQHGIIDDELGVGT